MARRRGWRNGARWEVIAAGVVERFWARVVPEPNTGCWLWSGSFFPEGYALLSVDTRPVGAHRISFQIAGGELIHGMHLDHLCRNRWCVNPDHLEQVSPRENTRRGHSPSAILSVSGVCSKGHPLSGANVRVWTRKSTGRQHRLCKSCHRERAAIRRGSRP